MEPVILVHGGAGNVPDSRTAGKLSGNRKSVEAGYKVLKEGGTALDAVEAAIRVMEEDEAFNAGYGSVLNLEGEVEMDASIMSGADLKAGAVTCVKDIANPIRYVTGELYLGGVPRKSVCLAWLASLWRGLLTFSYLGLAPISLPLNKECPDYHQTV